MQPKTRRNHEVWVNLFTRQGTPLGKLEGFLDGEISTSAYASVKSTGRILARDTKQIVGGEWQQYRLQPVYKVNGVEHKLGLYLPSTSQDDWDDQSLMWDVELADKTSILDRVVLGQFFTVKAGANIVETVKTLIELTGESAGALTPSPQTALGTITFEPGTTILQAVNDLLSAANFFSLWCDGDGQFQITPSVAVGSRPIVAEFVDGLDGTALYSPVFSREQDIASIPNRVIAISNTDGEDPALIAKAENRNPGSPYSFDALGRWIDHLEDGVETTSQAALQEYAQRRLESLSSAVANVVITCWFEDVKINDAIRFRSNPAKIDGVFTVSNVEPVLNELGMMTLKLREVVAV